jgi:hypothetical protein
MQENEKLNFEDLDISLNKTLPETTDEELQEGINTENEEGQEMSEEEQKQFFIEQLKKMRMRFNPVKNVGNKTINPYGAEFKQKRKKRNKQARASRKTNRKK